MTKEEQAAVNCQRCGTEITTEQAKSNDNRCDDCWIEDACERTLNEAPEK